ncbi:MAG TPA: amylo-alpha-1,6-glucosidase [Chthoniobacterales bacterium]|jgi:predicted glycogen debranching enzyme|nr:amylo-alpha-1,6-glucosidase [Chthoniobacterales bacterium]
MYSKVLPSPEAEWLEADGLGGFASGTVSGIRTRRYHGLLVPATAPPAGRTVLVNGFEAWIEVFGETIAISSQRYAPDVLYPYGASRLTSFLLDPWPVWTFHIREGLYIDQELFAAHGTPTVALRWELRGDFTGSAKLRIRPLLSGRDFHSIHHENGSFRFEAFQTADPVIWHPYQNLPIIRAQSNGSYAYDPCWYRNFLYVEEQKRGLDCIEDLASPGVFEWNISDGPAVWILSSDIAPTNGTESALAHYGSLRSKEQDRRRSFPSALHRAGDAYLVKRGEGKTIIAGYPWFGDWGRDTFIALRGLCLSTGRLPEARNILIQWAGAVSQGMLPNRFPDRGETPEFNSVDASLWYVIAVHDYFRVRESQTSGLPIDASDILKLRTAVEAILTGYTEGTRFNIHADLDGLLACGQPGVQLTWMDAKVGDWVVTPRIGKPVEVQALWVNALWIAGRFSKRWSDLFKKAKASFEVRFWNASTGSLFDVVDCDHRAGINDGSLRPNQIFAVGGLPLSLLEGEKARRVVETVEANLLTPIGLRSLGPREPAYAPHYEGGVVQRDGSYHQGTVWPWLIGPFVEAWLRIRKGTPEAKAEARERFLGPFRDHMHNAGIGHISEIADAEPPHAPRGCPFQAWSMGEYIRLQRSVLENGI